MWPVSDQHSVISGTATRNYSEKQVELVQQRLAAIEQKLDQLTLGQHSNPQSPHSNQPLSSISPSPSVPVEAYEGDVSFANQSFVASKAADRTAAGLGVNPVSEIALALASLRQSIATHDTATRSHVPFLSTEPNSVIPNLILPPVELVVTVVQKVTGL